jgi:hypothetical protein
MQNYAFAQGMNLQTGDVIVTPKSFMNIVEHYLIYWGRNDEGIDFYLENNHKVGVRWITEDLFVYENPKFLRIRRFYGNEYDRHIAIQRGLKLLGADYDVEKFNCESFANYIQFNKVYSTQVNAANSFFVGAAILTGIGLLVGASNNRR